MRRAKAYSSSCSQTVSLSLAISSQFILRLCEDRKINKKNPYFGCLGSFKVIDVKLLIRLKSSSLVLIVIGSMPMLICNRFHERLINNGKITTLTGVPFLMPSCLSFFERE